jgi:hypothetical protein
MSEIDKAIARMNKKQTPFKEASLAEKLKSEAVEEHRKAQRLKQDCKRAKKVIGSKNRKKRAKNAKASV